ncbi:hypothetical protein BASA81_001349 [Batrachochytrium salamandrivorans]|nr:hypothetical protein BASA81_002257 [Batrachochytrium salamandrivorans]KAH9260180.1 hypothetical protein BASA81_001349 [Batrachochytrium salamandrivorans]
MFRQGLVRLHQHQQRRRLCAAAKEKIKITFVAGDGSGDQETVYGEIGDSLLDVAHNNDLEIEGACGGEMACSTCHVILEDKHYTPPKEEDEEDMLDLAIGLKKTSRLGCQVIVTKEMDGMTVWLPASVNNMQG